jgi:hypothetical protein
MDVEDVESEIEIGVRVVDHLDFTELIHRFPPLTVSGNSAILEIGESDRVILSSN